MPDLLTRDPNLDVCPNFSSAPFEVTQALMLANGMMDEQVVNVLQDVWTAQNNVEHDQWTQEAEAREVAAATGEQQGNGKRQQQHPETPQMAPQADDIDCLECEQKEKLKLWAFNPNMQVSNIIIP
ncbi:hypothetical protein H0H87_011912 [Tephrocybe sp. NHM501043]|nr:hypothetical protein H0H87_011912 [Tephrocybe sp. NHM501043]